jgi:hypothetical protein
MEFNATFNNISIIFSGQLFSGMYFGKAYLPGQDCFNQKQITRKYTIAAASF